MGNETKRERNRRIAAERDGVKVEQKQRRRANKFDEYMGKKREREAKEIDSGGAGSSSEPGNSTEVSE